MNNAVKTVFLALVAVLVTISYTGGTVPERNLKEDKVQSPANGDGNFRRSLAQLIKRSDPVDYPSKPSGGEQSGSNGGGGKPSDHDDNSTSKPSGGEQSGNNNGRKPTDYNYDYGGKPSGGNDESPDSKPSGGKTPNDDYGSKPSGDTTPDDDSLITLVPPTTRVPPVVCDAIYCIASTSRGFIGQCCDSGPCPGRLPYCGDVGYCGRNTDCDCRFTHCHPADRPNVICYRCGDCYDCGDGCGYDCREPYYPDIPFYDPLEASLHHYSSDSKKQ